MFENYNNVPSRYENALERGVIQLCRQKGIEIDMFAKFGHPENGDEEQDLTYNLIIKSCSQESVDELAEFFKFDILDVEGNKYTLVKPIEFPAIDNIPYKELYTEEFAKVINSCDELVRKVEDELGISVDGLSNEDKFAKGIVWGELGCLVKQ